MQSLRVPWWLPEGHSQTIFPALWGRRSLPLVALTRERWTAPDGDFVDVHRSSPSLLGSPKPLLVLFHGLEGSAASHYAKLFQCAAKTANADFAVPHFRGCSGELNARPRAYHSGDHAEIDWILKRFKAENLSRPIVAVGVSLGGNALAHWVGLEGRQAAYTVVAAAAVSSPLDLTASGHAMGRGFNRHVYGRMFLQTMVPKALAKLRQHPGLFVRDAVLAAKTLHDFDEAFTAPVHGFGSAARYWQMASAKPLLRGAKIPLLLLNALNDPFVPASSLPTAQEVSNSVTLWQPEHGGHVGFPCRHGDPADPLQWMMGMPTQVCAWLLAQVGNFAQMKGD